MKILILGLLLLGNVCLAQTDVHVYYHGELYSSISFEEEARLDTLLRSPGLPEPIYWPAAQISTPTHQHAMAQEKSELLGRLADLCQQWGAQRGTGYQLSCQQLLAQLTSLEVSGRLPIVVDPDHAERSPTANPRLAGEYYLFVSDRQAEIARFGLLAVVTPLPLIPGAGIDHYYQRKALLPGAERAFVWLIQPTGEIERVPVASWNKVHREPMAGAAMFVGLNPDLLPNEMKAINQHIAQLIANRITLS